MASSNPSNASLLALLTRAKLPHLLEIFQQNDLDLDTLSCLTSRTDFNSEIKEPLGLNIGQGLRLWREIDNLRSGSSTELAITIDDSEDEEEDDSKKQATIKQTSSSSSSSASSSSSSTSSSTPSPFLSSLKISFPIVDPTSLSRAKKLVANNPGVYTVFTDGGSRGNPGISGAGAALYLPDGRPLAYLSLYCGNDTTGKRIATNNYAEYIGVVAGMTMALAFGVTQLIGKADSKLCVEQILGRWKCKSSNLKGLCAIAKDMKSQFNQCTWKWIPRNENTIADQYANEAMDGQGNNDFVRVASYDENSVSSSSSGGGGGGDGNSNGKRKSRDGDAENEDDDGDTDDDYDRPRKQQRT